MKDKGGFWRNRKVLVTGHEGFLGSWLAKALIEKGARLIGLDKVKNRPRSILGGIRPFFKGLKGDVADLATVKRVINKARPSIIFHLAAEALVGRANKKPVEAFKSNIEGTWNILEACRGKQFLEAVIVASSDKAYGTHEALPYTEDAALKGNHPYDVSKSCADLLAMAYCNTYDVPVCVTRCGNIYGPGDYHFSRIVPDTIRSALKDKTLLIRSDGKYTRDYIYAEDVVSGYIMLAEKMRKANLCGEAFNFSNEAPVSVLDLVKAIYQIVGKNPDYKILNLGRYEIKDQYLSAAKAKNILGWRPAFSLNEGLIRTIGWYRDTPGDR